MPAAAAAMAIFRRPAEAQGKPDERDANQRKRHGPQRVFQNIAQEIRRDHCIPGTAFRQRDQRHDQFGDILCGVRMRDLGQFAQHDGPLQGKAQLGQRSDRAADQHARKPGVEQTNALHVGARQNRAKGAAEYVDGTQQHQRFDREGAWAAAENVVAVAAVQADQQRDVERADGEQKGPPDRDRIRPGDPTKAHWLTR